LSFSARLAKKNTVSSTLIPPTPLNKRQDTQGLCLANESPGFAGAFHFTGL
jgi:hypothetical protein